LYHENILKLNKKAFFVFIIKREKILFAIKILLKDLTYPVRKRGYLMYFIGIVIVVLSIIIGNLVAGGHLSKLNQPAEYIIILGSAIGSFLAGNRKNTIKHVISFVKKAVTDQHTSKRDYLDLLCAMYSIFRLARTKSMVAVESHIEKPSESRIFIKYPGFLKESTGCTLFCDYVRMVSMGVDDPIIIEDLMRDEISNIKEETHEYVASVQSLADSLPALGIVAAVLGVIHTMGAIDQPPNVLGGLIAGALVGTFLGILVAYGFVAPIALRMKQTNEINQFFYDAIKACIISYIHQSPSNYCS
jgi:chemotaxis protein MotA